MAPKFAFMYLGMQASKPLHIKKLHTFHKDTGRLTEQYYVDMFGRQVKVPLVKKTLFHPDYKTHTGQQLGLKPGGITSTGYHKPPDMFTPGYNPYAMTLRDSFLPSTVVGVKPIIFKGVIPGITPTSMETFYQYRIQPPTFKTDIKLKPIIDITKTPAHLRKPITFHKLFPLKSMPDITAHEGHPFKKISSDDWMSRQIPDSRTLSTVVFPKPILFRSYEILGHLEFKLTPYHTTKGMGILGKITLIPSITQLKPFTKPQLPTDTKPFVRAIDSKGKQIGHEFIGEGYKTTIGKPKFIGKPDYSLPSKQIHTPGDFFEGPAKAGDLYKVSKRLVFGKPRKSIYYEQYKGETTGIPKPQKGITIRPTSDIVKRNLFHVFGYKPFLYFGVVGGKPLVEPIIKSFSGFKGKTYTLKDLTKKWEMGKVDPSEPVIKLGGTGRQQLLLKPLEVKTEQKQKIDKTIKTRMPIEEKVSESWLRQIGRFDLEEAIHSKFATPFQPTTSLITPLTFSGLSFKQPQSLIQVTPQAQIQMQPQSLKQSQMQLQSQAQAQTQAQMEAQMEAQMQIPMQSQMQFQSQVQSQVQMQTPLSQLLLGFGIPEPDERKRRITKKKKKTKRKRGYRKRVHPVGFYDWLGGM
jgi:hypothetical protein